MPVSLRLAFLLVAGSAAGLRLPVASATLFAALSVVAAAAAWRAHARGITGASAALLAVAILSAATCRSVVVRAEAEHPSLVEWFDRATGGTPEGEARVRETPTLIRGRLMRDASPTDYGAQLPVAVTRIRRDGRWVAASGGVVVSVAGGLLEPLPDWRAGRVVTLPVALRAPTTYRNHGLADQARVLAYRGTPLVGSAKSGALVTVEATGSWWDERAADARARVRAAMHTYVAPHDPLSAAVGTAILIGDRTRLPADVESRLQEAGTYHVVAISGGNIALLAAAVLAVLWAARIRFAAAAAVAAVVLVAHAWMIGGGSSVMRATVMALVYLGLRLIDQRTAPVHAIGVAAAAVVAFNPLEIAGAGFWLTFGATGALLMAAARGPQLRHRRWWAPILGLLVASIAVELLLMPVSAFVFERVTIAGLLLNLAAVPAMALVQGAASACVLADAAHFEMLARASGILTHLAARALVESSGLVSHAPWSTWRVPAPPLGLLASYYLLVAGWWALSAPPVDTWRRQQARRLAVAAILASWLWMASAPLTWLTPGAGPLRITAFDVGQGDAVLVTAPDGLTVMIDAGGLGSGGAFDIGDRVVGPALRARGLRRLDYVALTHGDLDHLGGAGSLLKDFAPRELWAGVPVPGHAPLDRLVADARAGRTPWRWLQRGDRLELGGVELRVHHPPLPDWERRRVRNDDSLVIEVRYGAVSVWLTGDISRAVEDEIVARAEPGRITIVKAAHHGSLTSSGSTWVARLRPAVVLFSAGRGNLFGHPAPAVVERYESVNAEVFRTDRDGQIEVTTNGTYLEVTTYTGRRWRLR